MSIVCAALLVGSAAHAQEETVGKLGVGVDRPLAFFGSFVGPSQPGIGVTFNVNPLISVQGIIGYRSDSADDNSESDLGIGLRGFFDVLTFLVAEDAAVRAPLVGGLVIHRESADVGGMDTSATNFAVEAGVRPEWFVNQWFSVHTEIGIALEFLSEDSGIEGTGISIFANGEVMGNAGFTFWFN